MKQVEFIYVDGLNSNSNKFYRMIDTEDGNFRVEYGRIGLTLITETYPIGKWDSKYKEKVRKGYKDVTDLKIESSGGSFQFSSTDVEHFYGVFSRYTTNNVKQNYTIAVGSVTKAMIDEAQQILNSLTRYPKLDVFNKHLLELYTVLPRKMKNVKDFLPSVEDQGQLQKLIAKLVPTYEVKTLEEIEVYHEQFLSLGYEGTMIRLDLGGYENKRSKQLLKYKSFQDDEFTILDVIEGEGNRSGMAGKLICALPNGGTVGVSMTGTQEFMTKVLKDKSKIIGLQATVKYFGYTNDGSLRFPTLKTIINY